MLFKWKYSPKLDILNTNLDAVNNLEIKCNGELIPIVTKFTLLGVSIDQYLNFDQHTISLCSKVSWKLSVLKKSSYLFDLKFRIILFKLFIQSKYDYCSTLFSNLSNKANTSRLDKSFAKSLKKYLGINLSEMDIPQHYIYLRDFKLLPLKIRFFKILFFSYLIYLKKTEKIRFLNHFIN